MNEPTELLPCPFCGGAPTTVARADNIDGTQFFYAIACYCGRYSACAHKMVVRKTPEIAKADAVAAWNTRTPQPTQAQAVAVPTREFLERTLAAMEGVIDVADRKTDEFDALRSCVIDLTLMLFSDAKRHAKEAAHCIGETPRNNRHA